MAVDVSVIGRQTGRGGRARPSVLANFAARSATQRVPRRRARAADVHVRGAVLVGLSTDEQPPTRPPRQPDAHDHG